MALPTMPRPAEEDTEEAEAEATGAEAVMAKVVARLVASLRLGEKEVMHLEVVGRSVHGVLAIMTAVDEEGTCVS